MKHSDSSFVARLNSILALFSRLRLGQIKIGQIRLSRFLFAAGLTVIFPLFPACNEHGEEVARENASQSLPPVRVKIERVEWRPHAASEDVVGTARSKLRALVEAKVSGRIVEYNAVPGARVKKGDLLARLDVQEIQAKVDQVRATLDQAQRDFDRQARLIESNATARQDYEAAEARVKVATAALSEAETMLGYARVTAPFDGVVARKLADMGDLAMPGKPLVEVEDPSALRFEADLPETLLSHVKQGDKLSVQLTKPVEGTVSEISPVADPASRTFLVKLDLPPTEGIRTGQFGRVSVPLGEVKRLFVPRTAVLKRGQMEMTFIVEDGRAVMRLVKTGRAYDDQIEILSGLEGDETVIVSDSTKLHDGQSVTE